MYAMQSVQPSWQQPGYAQHMCVWLQLHASLERLQLCCYPHRASRIAARCKRIQENLATMRQGDSAGEVLNPRAASSTATCCFAGSK
jgi:hypothetical protein